MQLSSLLGHCDELIRIIRKSTQPADSIAAEYLRSKKYIGARDRRFISGHTFHTLRILSLAEAYAKAHNIEQLATAAYELDGESDWARSQPVHIQVNTQEWLLQETSKRWPDADKVWKAMMAPAPVGIRVNLRRASRSSVLEALQAEGLNAEPGSLSPASIILRDRIQLTQHPLYLDGVIEIQDEGSQLIGLACNVTPGMHVLDACAGAGGKSLHLADIMNNQGAIVARDIEWTRLREIARRATRAGVSCIRAIHTPASDTHERPRQLFDVVLVDAPCSGIGTVRRMPMVKWKLAPEQAGRHQKKQLRLLAEFARETKPNGLLVYATCSVLPIENEDVVDRFLAENLNFTLEESMQVDPYHHNTDGLFWARMRRLS